MNRMRAGFTLIEMLGVIAIMALLSSAAAVMLSGSRHAANVADSIEQLAQADASTRVLARSSNQTSSLAITLSSGLLRRSVGNMTTTLGNLPGDVRIERVRLSGSATDFGSASISVSPQGSSATYAVKFASSAGGPQWIVFSGLTGQMLKVNDEDVDEVLQEIGK